jgi:3-isopropylmalate/(R)-2-methylmalate dehydratase small subunit
MSDFVPLVGVAAPLPDSNLDTDIIFPARFLLLPNKTGLGKQLFHERRFGGASQSRPFVLDTAPFDKARILVTGSNFGSGSSREQAVWALADFGIRCVIAPSFGEIFFNNCFKNGLLPIVLPQAVVDAALSIAATGALFSVDLENQTLHVPDMEAVRFDVDPYRRRILLLGLDEIGAILADDSDDIRRFEAEQRTAYPWLYLGDEKRAYFDDLKAQRDAERALNE